MAKKMLIVLSTIMTMMPELVDTFSQQYELERMENATLQVKGLVTARCLIRLD